MKEVNMIKSFIKYDARHFSDVYRRCWYIATR